jgi:hypothetical protein
VVVNDEFCVAGKLGVADKIGCMKDDNSEFEFVFTGLVGER